MSNTIPSGADAPQAKPPGGQHSRKEPAMGEDIKLPEPVAWVAADTLHSPHPRCVSSLAYMSQIDKDRVREYVPLYAAPVAAQKADDDGDALRLACTLEIDVSFRVVGGSRVEALAPGGPRIIERYTKASERASATRRAIARAATVMFKRENKS